MHCKICDSISEKRFEGLILGTYAASYYACTSCGFLQVQEPTWLEEAYRCPINACDTGILHRNERLRESVSVLLYHFFDPKLSYLDFAGGYGIFTRLMRDVGFDFYWMDKYTENVFAKGFEYRSQPVGAVTAFEVLEHLADPVAELQKMLSLSRNLIFTTQLLPDPVPSPHEWWYYGIEHGQHISFYTRNSLERLAERFGLQYYSFRDLHVMTDRQLPRLRLKLAQKSLRKLRLFERLRKKMTSRSNDDMHFVLSLETKS